MEDVIAHNRNAWNRQAREGCRWSIPVGPEAIVEARAGRPHIILTPDTPLPLAWLGDLPNKDLLCLASGGGQQAPLLAAAGATVTSFDLSEEQLALDTQVAQRESLTIRTVQGDMRDLSVFDSDWFDLIVNVCSNTFCPELAPVWQECYRVLRPGGELLAGFLNPVFFLFDWDALDRGEDPMVRYPLPYSDKQSLPLSRYQKLCADGEPLCFSHSLDSQIGGQIAAGFAVIGFFEDGWKESPLDPWLKTGICTRARKLDGYQRAEPGLP